MKSFMLIVLFVFLGCTNNTERPYATLENSEVICPKCTQDELAQETKGIRMAAKALVEYVGGSNLMPEYAPVDIHLHEDSQCPRHPEYSAYYSPERGVLCLFEYESHYEKQYECTDCAPVDTLPAQHTMIHESLHAWFKGRVEYDYRIEEGLCRYVELDVSGILDFIVSNGNNIDTNPCTQIFPKTENVVLVDELCSLGLTSDHVRQFLRATDEAVTKKGAPLTSREFSAIVTQAMGQDSAPAFHKANIF